jgi:hypothetical protein
MRRIIAGRGVLRSIVQLRRGAEVESFHGMHPRRPLKRSAACVAELEARARITHGTPSTRSW